MKDEKVEFANKSSSNKRWGIGQWFYVREGDKNRIRSRALVGIIGGIFLITLIFGLLKENPAEVVTSESPISSPSIASQESSSIEVSNFISRQDEHISEKINSDNGESSKKVKNRKYIGFQKVKSQYLTDIPPGTMIRAKLLSGASDGPLRAILIEDLKAADEVIADSGTILVGQGVSNEERLAVTFQSMVFADGSFMQLEAQACDESDKMPGLKGSNVRGEALKLAGAIGLGLVGGTAIGLQTRQNQAMGPTQPSMKDALLNGAGTASLEQARSLTGDLQNTKPLYEVPENTIFYVLFTGGKK